TFPARVASRPTRTRWHATPRCARKPDSFPSSSWKCSWMKGCTPTCCWLARIINPANTPLTKRRCDWASRWLVYGSMKAGLQGEYAARALTRLLRVHCGGVRPTNARAGVPCRPDCMDGRECRGHLRHAAIEDLRRRPLHYGPPLWREVFGFQKRFGRG